MEDHLFLILLGSRLGEERVTHGDGRTAIPRTRGIDLVALGDILACAVHLVDHMGDIHLAQEVIGPEDGIGTVVGHEPGQTLHVPAHVLHAGEVEFGAGTGGAVVVLGEVDRLVIGIAVGVLIFTLGIDILVAHRSKGVEAKDGIGKSGTKVHEVAVGGGAVRRSYRLPERGVVGLEDIVLGRTRSTVVAVGIEVEG